MRNQIEQIIEQMIGGGILFEEALQEFEKLFIQNMLTRHNNNLSKAAVALGIHRNTLSKRLAEYQNGNGTGVQKNHKSSKPRKQISPRLKIRKT